MFETFIKPFVVVVVVAPPYSPILVYHYFQHMVGPIWYTDLDRYRFMSLASSRLLA